MTDFDKRTAKPVLHGRHWIAITGKPLAATAGAMMFQRGGNAVDAACAMLAATSTMWDVLSWGGETQALIYDPNVKKVFGINALGVAPTGATVEFFQENGSRYPPSFGPLAAVTPGTPGGLTTMLAEFGTLHLADVLDPAIQMAEGYAIEAETADTIEDNKSYIKRWTHSRDVFLTHPGEAREAPLPGEVFRQPDLAATLRKLVEAEHQALEAGRNRVEAISAAYDRFYKGDIAESFVLGAQESGALITLEDLATWKVHIEDPVTTNYRGIDVYKLAPWVQGPVMLQALNILENFDLQAMGYNSARYTHVLYQAMNLAFADRDFYYGDPHFAPGHPIAGLLSKEYARERADQIKWQHNDPDVKPGDPYPYCEGHNPYLNLIEHWPPKRSESESATESIDTLQPGTTSIQAADEEGWVVSATPSGGWIPAVIAGSTGIGLSQRMQSFVLDPTENPFNVVEPGKRPRSTLTPSLALKNGSPFLSFAVQGGDLQDQDLLQFFLNFVEFGMNVQEAAEAPNFHSYQLHESFGEHRRSPGRLTLNDAVPSWVSDELRKMGYRIGRRRLTSGPINAIYFDAEHGTFWGASSNYGDDHGVTW